MYNNVLASQLRNWKVHLLQFTIHFSSHLFHFDELAQKNVGVLQWAVQIFPSAHFAVLRS
jgi:hypothetical protein